MSRAMTNLGKFPSVLTHFSEEPLIFDPQREYPLEEGRQMKPRGFWLSDESDYGWRSWSTDEDFRTGWLAYRTEFKVRRGSNVLMLSTLGEILEFTRQNQIADDWRPTNIMVRATDERPGFFNLSRGYIDWAKVMERWDGIVITPYNWDGRMHMDTMWYYGWDCASGCFWNLSAIEQVGESVPVPESERTYTPYRSDDDEDPLDEPAAQDEPERVEVPIIPGGYTMTTEFQWTGTPQCPPEEERDAFGAS